MLRRMLVAVFALVLALSFSSLTFAQDAAKKEGKLAPKKEMSQTMKSVSCDPDCGFMVRSHDEKELSSIVINHAKTAHNKTVTEADVKKMMKTEAPAKKM